MYANEENDGDESDREEMTLEELLGLKPKPANTERSSKVVNETRRTSSEDHADDEVVQKATVTPQPLPRRAPTMAKNPLSDILSTPKPEPESASTDEFLAQLGFVTKPREAETHEEASDNKNNHHEQHTESPEIKNEENVDFQHIEEAGSINFSQLPPVMRPSPRARLPRLNRVQEKSNSTEDSKHEALTQPEPKEITEMHKELAAGQIESEHSAASSKTADVEDKGTVSLAAPKPTQGRRQGRQRRRLSASTENFNDSQSLRHFSYRIWLEEKAEEEREKRAAAEKAKQIEEQKLKEKETRIANASATFISWKKKKEEALAEKHRAEMRKLKAKEEKEKEDKEQKKRETESAFLSWQKTKNEKLAQQSTEHKAKIVSKIAMGQAQKEQKKVDAEKAFKAWKTAKDIQITEVVTSAKQQDKRRSVENKKEKISREVSSLVAYENWLREKEEERLRKILYDATFGASMSTREGSRPSTPWLPPNRTIARTRSASVTNSKRR